MEDRRFTKIDLRRMLQRAAKHRSKAWEVIIETDFDRQVLVVVTAYPVWE
jgi:hypothetical protein